MSEVSLGYRIDSSQAKTAAVDLDKMAASSVKADAGAKKLAASTKVADTATGQLAAETMRLVAAENASVASQNASAAAAAKNAAAMGTSRAAVTNLSYQFNDIATMMASGQNPLQLALQQGTQIGQVLGPMGAGGAVKALGAGFLAMVNPISIATIATIGLGAAAFQYLSGLIADGQKGNATLEDQTDLIMKVADRWGDATPALKAYADELERAQAAEEKRQAVGFAVDQSFSGLTSQLPELTAYMAAAQVDLQGLGASSSEIKTLRDAFDDLTARVKDGTAQTSDLDRVLTLLATTTGADMVPSLVDLRSVLDDVSAGLSEAAEQANRLRGDLSAMRVIEGMMQTGQNTANFVNEQIRLNGLTSDQLALEREIKSVKREAADAGALLTDEVAKQIALNNLAADKSRSPARSAQKTDAEREAEAYSRLTLSVQQRASSAELEARAIGMTTEAANRMRAEQDALNAAVKQGIDLSVIDASTGLSRRDTLLMTADAAAAAEERTRLLTQAANDNARLWGIAEDGASGFFKTLSRGGDVLDVLIGKVFDLGDAFIEMSMRDLFNNNGAGGGFNPLGMITGAIGSLFGGGGFTPTAPVSPFYAGFANGTNNAPGGWSWVGEQGPELRYIERGSKIVPHQQSMRMAANANSSGSVSLTVNVIGANGGDDVEARAYAGAQRALEEYDATLPAKVDGVARSVVNDPQVQNRHWKSA